MSERKVYTLSQISTAIQRRIEEATGGRSFWIKAEIANYKRNKHAYLELVEHRNGEKVAVMRAAIWNSTFEKIQVNLGQDSVNILKAGVEILFRCRTNYHLVYGLSLTIEEIDLSFNMGELERRKQATIAALKQEGLFDRNRLVAMPIVLQRIALITSEGSAAYTDFMKHLGENEYRYRFHVHLYNSGVQGDAAAAQLRAAMAAIPFTGFDAVVIIRGGGSKLDLEPFNDLELARAIANCPIPVLTGIGHDVDVSVLDMIARGPHKTPTAVADHLVDVFVAYESDMNNFLVGIQNAVLESFAGYKERLSAIVEIMKAKPVSRCQTLRGALHTTTTILTGRVTDVMNSNRRLLDGHTANLGVYPRQLLLFTEATRIEQLATLLRQTALRKFELATNRITSLQEAIEFLAPDRLLGRGFSITRKGEKAVVDPSTLSVGDQVVTTYSKGRSWSTINRIENNG